jgi:hypothetical protein
MGRYNEIPLFLLIVLAGALIFSGAFAFTLLPNFVKVGQPGIKTSPATPGTPTPISKKTVNVAVPKVDFESEFCDKYTPCNNVNDLIQYIQDRNNHIYSRILKTINENPGVDLIVTPELGLSNWVNGSWDGEGIQGVKPVLHPNWYFYPIEIICNGGTCSLNNPFNSNIAGMTIDTINQIRSLAAQNKVNILLGVDEVHFTKNSSLPERFLYISVIMINKEGDIVGKRRKIVFEPDFFGDGCDIPFPPYYEPYCGDKADMAIETLKAFKLETRKGVRFSAFSFICNDADILENRYTGRYFLPEIDNYNADIVLHPQYGFWVKYYDFEDLTKWIQAGNKLKDWFHYSLFGTFHIMKWINSYANEGILNHDGIYMGSDKGMTGAILDFTVSGTEDIDFKPHKELKITDDYLYAKVSIPN